MTGRSKRASNTAIGRRLIAGALVAAMFASACSSDDDGATTTTTTIPSTDLPVTTTGGGDGPGTTAGGGKFAGLRLSKGTPQAPPAEPVAVVDGTQLDDAAIRAVIDRLPAWSTDDQLEQPFNWPAQTVPPPRTGATTAVAFPSAEQVPPEEVPSGPLHVLRVQPEGDVPIAPFVSITFDQPMVPVGTVGQVNGGDVPVTIEPAITGRWQWIGTRTLRFDADPIAESGASPDRLPMATQYTVEIGAGTLSAADGELADAVSFQFATPPPTIQSFQPTGPSQPLTPVFLATFDQQIDPAAVLATVIVQADGDDHPVRLATAEEIAADVSVQQVVDIVPAGRWLAFRPVQPFAADASITIEFPEGTPSAEGPITTPDDQTFSAHTFQPLTLTSVECGYGSGCVPGTQFDVVFNNSLDAAAFDPATVRVEPPIAGATVGVFGNTIAIRGATEANTEYTVTIPSGLTDVFGQQLAQDEVRSVSTGDPMPFLHQFTQPFTTLDPSADRPSVSVASLGHDELRVRVFAPELSDWLTFPQTASDLMYSQSSAIPSPPWSVVFDTTIDVDGGADALAQTEIDLSEALPGGLGHAIVMVESTTEYPVEDNRFWMNRPAISWVQSTKLGLDAFTDNDEARAWVTDLATGAPVPRAVVRLVGASATATTDEDGLATLTLQGTGSSAMVANVGDDAALLPNGYFGGGWGPSPVSDSALWYVFDDRQTYRPSETASVKGWVRRLTSSTDAQVRLFADDTVVTYTARDSQGSVIAEGRADVNPLGGFDLTIAIPAGANLGEAYLELSIDAAGIGGVQQHWHMFQIQEFRRPEFEVVVRAESVGPYVAGQPATVAVDADYYAGGPLGAAPVTWQVNASAGTYSPPGWDEFQFGRWTPWWYDESPFGGFASIDECCGPSVAPDVQQYSGTTDAAGNDYLQIDVGDLGDELANLPVSISAQATVQDVNRQALASSTSLLVHPADLYVGLRSERTFVRRGDALDIELVVTDIDGQAVAGRDVTVTAGRTETTFANGTWVDEVVDVQTCTITSAAEAVTCAFTTDVGGAYAITSTVVDDSGRSSISELTRWVSSAESVPDRRVQQQQLTIVPDQQEYRPGDSAELLVQAPFSTGTGLLVVVRNGIQSTQRFELVDGSAVLQVPIAENDIPNVDISIEVVGTTPRVDDAGDELVDAPPRPAFAAGSLTLAISTASRALTVTATPIAAELRPGESTQVEVAVIDAAGQPVAGGELAVVVVDEAVLALSNYQLDDPLHTFYAQLPSYLSAQFGRQSIVLVDPTTFLGGGARGDSDESAEGRDAATGGAPEETVAPDDGGGLEAPAAVEPEKALAEQQNAPPIDVRTNFEALAVFAPDVVTDSAGHATIDVPLPDNLTRYRVMVVAVAGEQQFGSGEANITARLPLMVRPSAPRFLNFGDAIELPVVVQNQTDAAMDVDVVLQTANLAPAEPIGKRVSVPANDRVEVRFAVSAAGAGTARFRVSAASGDAADAATVELPVYTPATAEAFATYGVVDDGAIVQPVIAPAEVIPQFGGLDVTTSSTSLQALTDAVIYLSEYRYESSDALASRILAIAALRDVLDAFDAPGLPAPAALRAAVDRDIALLVAMQRDDGGFPFWSRSRPSEPFNSIQVAHALLAAREAGYAVPGDVLDRALAFIADIESHIPSEYERATRDTLVAYSLNVRMLAGDRDATKAEALWDDRGDELPLDAIAWLWPVVDDPSVDAAIERLMGNRAVDTAGSVTFTTAVDDAAYVTLTSDRRTDGLILDALIGKRPDSDLIPKVVSGLLAGQRQGTGRWDNVQENAFILLALRHYFDAFESQTPDFVARIWLGQQFAGDQPFSGRSIDRNLITIATEQLLEIGNADLTIGKEGTGRLYYRIGLRTAPASLQLDPLDRGFVVTRSYAAVDDPADVSQDEDGTWHIRAGARVRVRLTMVAESQRTHVALIDPLPAGLEIMNPALAVTGELPTDPDPEQPPGDGPIRTYFPWYPTWFEHQNLRDDRAEAFAGHLAAGTYDYSYVARATTPGTFVAPPTRAEEIYAPETFGRAGTDTVIIG